jgi:phosphopantothenoylcysteine synthetase/decarboxylase
MKVIVTCGPGHEPIDQARRITNFSTGRLGVVLSNTLTAHGWEVICCKGELATCDEPLRAGQICRFSTNEDLSERLRILSRAERIGAVFHAAALCDFRVESVLNEEDKPISSAKFPTQSGRLKLILAPALKILPSLRDWFPEARIVGWKYELEGSREDALAKARRQIQENRTDACVLNGSAYGPGFALCEPAGKVSQFPDAGTLAEALSDWMKRQ